MDLIKRLLGQNSNEIDCPRCNGKGSVNKEDIARLKRELIWEPGPCKYCNETGMVTNEHIKKVKVDSPFYPLSLTQEQETNLMSALIKREEINKLSNDVESPENIPYNKKPSKIDRYAIHRKGFYYDDEAFGELENQKGSLLGFYENLSDAKEAIIEADINAFRKLKGTNAVDYFMRAKDYDEIFEEIDQYYLSEYGIKIKDRYWFELPKTISNEQAKTLLSIMKISFHIIVEYDDPTIVEQNSFPDFDTEEYGEFS